MNFIPSTVTPAKIEDSYWFIFKGNCLLIQKQQELATIPLLDYSHITEMMISHINYMGTYNSKPCYTAVLITVNLQQNFHLKELRMLFGLLEDSIYSVACRAFEIVHWDKTHQFCGQCGSVMQRSSVVLSKVCTCCKLENYPRISPAIIVAITKGDSILLARHHGSDVFTVIAGYVEIGESLEETVKREAMEEVNIEVNNITYFGSQSWVFSHALMIAYTAEYHKGELKPDGVEIEEACWFSKNDIPSKIPRVHSISRKLIDWFLKK